jgi:hypothetical protein
MKVIKASRFIASRTDTPIWCIKITVTDMAFPWNNMICDVHLHTVRSYLFALMEIRK